MGKYSTPVVYAGQKRPAPQDQKQAQKKYPPIDWSCVDVIAVIEQHTSTRLSRQGKQWVGACPFSDCLVDEDGFIVWPSLSSRNQHYYCRGCQRKGDLINLLQEVRGWSFLGAKKELGLLDDDDTQRVTYTSEARKRQAQIEKRQQEQLTMLRHLYSRMRAALSTYEQPQAYLASRGVSLEQAQHYGLGYIPTSQETGKEIADELRAWQGRIIFPLTSPGIGELTFAGRTLALWQPGMTPAEHKAAIDTYNAQFERGDKRRMIRVLKTSPCGHFGYRGATANGHTQLVICEGEFDALSLLVAGIEGVIAMGTGFSPSLIPLAVETVILAMDADAPGKRAAYQLSQALADVGLETRQILPAVGKDWNDLLITSPATICELFEADHTTDSRIPEHCADCGTHISDLERDFFYWQVSKQEARCYCVICRDSETGEPHPKSPGVVQDESDQDTRKQRFMALVERVAAAALPGPVDIEIMPGTADEYIARRKQELAEALHARWAAIR
jgi:hypothetical protein